MSDRWAERQISGPAEDFVEPYYAARLFDLDEYELNRLIAMGEFPKPIYMTKKMRRYDWRSLLYYMLRCELGNRVKRHPDFEDSVYVCPEDVPAEVFPKVYFISCGEYVKIGWAKSVEKRVKELQTANPLTLTVLATVPGSLEDEARYHKRFAHLSARPDGEWFHHKDDLKDFIELVQSGGVA